MNTCDSYKIAVLLKFDNKVINQCYCHTLLTFYCKIQSIAYDLVAKLIILKFLQIVDFLLWKSTTACITAPKPLFGKLGNAFRDVGIGINKSGFANTLTVRTRCHLFLLFTVKFPTPSPLRSSSTFGTMEAALSLSFSRIRPDLAAP